MARSSRMSVQKRLRERKKAEQAELKRVTRRNSDGAEKPPGGQVAEREPGTPVADRDELEGYGVLIAPSSDRDEP